MNRLAWAAVCVALLVAGCASKTAEQVQESSRPEMVSADLLCLTEESALSFIDHVDTPEHYFAHVKKMESAGACVHLPAAYPFILGRVVVEFESAGVPGLVVQITSLSGEVKAYTLVRRAREATPSRYLIHGDAGWIMNHPKHGWRCGPEDCHAIPADIVTTSPMGFIVEWRGYKRTILYSEAKPSIDSQYWLCESTAESGHFIRCLFAPDMGA